jgi:hypothetical protein
VEYYASIECVSAHLGSVVTESLPTAMDRRIYAPMEAESVGSHSVVFRGDPPPLSWDSTFFPKEINELQ